MSDFSNKTIWLTGASSGIGLSVLKKLLEANAKVVVTGRNLKDLEALQEKYPGRIQFLYCDLSDQASIADLKGELHSRFESLDYVILNAGICEYVDVDAMDIALYNRVMQVNFLAAVECSMIALPLLKKAQQKSQLIFVSSLVTMLPFTRSQAYGASKAALNYYADSLRVDLKGEVDVSVVQPGFVDTPLTQKNDFPMPFLINADEAADNILSVLRSRKASVAFPKRFYYVLKLLSISPAFWNFLSGKFLVRT